MIGWAMMSDYPEYGNLLTGKSVNEVMWRLVVPWEFGPMNR